MFRISSPIKKKISQLPPFLIETISSFFVGKGGFGNTKFIAFEKLAWHYECFICAACNESMVGKGTFKVLKLNIYFLNGWKKFTMTFSKASH
jgi:hypothetical protein